MAMQIGELAPAMELPQVFHHDSFGDIRIRVDANNDIEINLEDAARGLGFTQTKNGVEYIRWERVNGYLKDFGFSPQAGKDGAYIPEHIFYRLAMKANNETAEKFQDWIAREVIPAIRKHGAYMTPATIEQVLTDPDFIIRLATELKAARKKIEAQAEVIEMQDAKLADKEAQIAELAPKADYCEAVLKSDETMPVRQIAQNYGMNSVQFNKLLAELGVQFKQGGVWYLYEKYNALGWTVTETFCFTRSDGTSGSNTRTVWTQRGKQGLYELLKEHGYEPTAK